MYTEKLSFGKLDNSLTVKVSNWYTTMSRQKLFALQDPYHVAKKLRNQLSLTETRVLLLGTPDTSRESEVVARWDYIMQVAIKDPAFLLICSKSSVEILDKQDPSLVGELASLYQYFIDKKMFALGLYLKSIQLFLEAFYDDSLLPEERMQRAWYTKTFFVVWDNNAPLTEYFIWKSTFQDLQCAIDGLLQYLLLLQRDFRECPILPKYLGSEINENGCGFVRTRRYAGRRTNLDGINLAYGLEKMNKHTEVNKDYSDVACVVAHTRGSHVLRPVYGLDEAKRAVQNLTGADINIQNIIVAMERGTRDCFSDCKLYNLNFVQDSQAGTRNVSDDESSSSEDEETYTCGFSDFLDSGNAEVMDNETVNTPLGAVNRQRAESYYLNEGRSNIGAKGRQSRFYYNYYEQSKLAVFNIICTQDECSLASTLKKGDVITLPEFHKKNTKRPKRVTGTVQFISKDHKPIKVLCKDHSPQGVNVWLFYNGHYYRCLFN